MLAWPCSYIVIIYFSCNLNISLLQGLHPSHHGPIYQWILLSHYLAAHQSTAEVPPACQSPSTSSLVVVAKGIPPIPHNLVEKIRKWEYVDLASLLDDHDHSTADQVAILLNGQLTVVNGTSQRHRQKNISDILTWLQAFGIFTAILVSSDATTKEEAAGLHRKIDSRLRGCFIDGLPLLYPGRQRQPVDSIIC